MSTNVIIITSKGCKKCSEMKRLIHKIAVNSGIVISMRELDIDDDQDEAVDLALEHGLEEVPSALIGGKVFMGENIDTIELKSALLSA